MPKISVLLTDAEEERFDAYCREKGFKKSTLAARLIREHLDSQHYAMQRSLSLASDIAQRGQVSSQQPVRGKRRNA